MKMYLNHLNLSVQNVAVAREFFETYFDFTAADSKVNDTLTILNGADGFLLVIMNERLNQNGNNAYPDSFHIGFYMENEDAVKDKFNRLKDGGVPVEQLPQKIRRTFGFYFHFENIMIEIACPVSAEE